MELCNISLGDEVLISGINTVVKNAFPINSESIASVSLTKSGKSLKYYILFKINLNNVNVNVLAIEIDNLGTLIKIQKLKEVPYLAKEVILQYLGKQPLPPLSSEFDMMIKSQNDERIFSIGNRICIPFYNRKLMFRIAKVKFDTDRHLDEEEAMKDLSQELSTINISNDKQRMHLYKTIYKTKWIAHQSKKDSIKKRRLSLNDIGGYSDLIAKLKNLMDDALGVCGEINTFIPFKGILLYGPPGVGKSLIANTLISEYGVNSVTISVLNLAPKNFKDTDTVLKDLFEEAISKTPSVILLEDIDTLCPKMSSSSSDQERKLLATLLNLFDELKCTNIKVAVLATTSKLDFVDSSLRRAGRLQKEFEVGVPDRIMRKEILSRILLKVPHTLTDQNIENISCETHGFVAADLEGLCSEARSHAKERVSNKSSRSIMENVEITLEDMQYASRNVNPSAMKEALVEVPNVKWSEIGGQSDLKLKLKQAVEWPLKHPEVFQRMGVVPPKGVLMFGPPGCSKTMIAKALATESNLNFLNINVCWKN